MRVLVQLLTLLVTPLAAYADAFPGDAINLPEPETLALFGIGAVALLLSAKRKK